MTNTTPNIDLFSLISQVETNHNSKAVRFEPATYSKLSVLRTDSQKLIIAAIQKANACSWGTALMIYSTSWGTAQIMGFNLYGPYVKYTKDVISYCDSQTDQENSFADLTIHMCLHDIAPVALAASATVRNKFAVTWNGSPEYADGIVAALKLYHFSVTE